MTERAIDRLLKIMRENLRGFTRHDIDSDSYNRGYAYCLEEYIERGEQMAQEEKSHKAEAPASLVEELREWAKRCGLEDEPEIDDMGKAFQDFDEILSRAKAKAKEAKVTVSDCGEYVFIPVACSDMEVSGVVELGNGTKTDWEHIELYAKVRRNR